MMSKVTKWIYQSGFVLIFSALSFAAAASVAPSTTETVSEKVVTKIEKKQDRLHKKINKIQQKVIKAKEKAGESVFDDAGFLEGSDDRVRWGLIGVAGGILLSLVLTSGLKFIGTLAIIIGLGLLVWYLIES